MNDESEATSGEQKTTVAKVFLAFLRLGLTSFGGPVVHIGYFHDEFVVRRKWVDELAYGVLEDAGLAGGDPDCASRLASAFWADVLNV